MKLHLADTFRPLPPGPGRFPYVAPVVAWRMRQNMIGELAAWYHAYGPAFTLRMPGLALVFLVGPEANQRMLVTHARDFTWGDGFLGELIPFIGYGLLTTDDEPHDRARRLLNPLFTPARVRGYAARMVARAEAAAAALRDGEIVELHGWARALALGIASDVLFGMDADRARAEAFAHHFEAGLSFFGKPYSQTLVLRGPGTPFAAMRAHASRIDAVLSAEIRARRARGAGGESVLDLLLSTSEGGDRFTDREARDHAMTLLFAGHDTTAASVSWLFVLLGQHPEVLRRVNAELDAELGDRAPTADDLVAGLPYLEQVVKETLRLYPPAWFGPRRTRRDFEIYGHTIPANTHVAYCSWLTHRIPELFPDPDAFDPERFAPERAKRIPPGAYVPFGRGARICIGMRFGELEVKAIAVALLRRARLELFPGQDFRARTVPTISPREGVRVFVRPRGAATATATTTTAREPSAREPSAGAGGREAAGASPAAARCPVAHDR